jgi:hypothetical protein
MKDAEECSEVDSVGGRVRLFCNDFPNIPLNKFITSQKPEVYILPIVNGDNLVVLDGTRRIRDCENT